MKSIQVVLRKHEFPEHNNVNLRIPFVLPKNLKVSFKIRLSLSNNIIIARFLQTLYHEFHIHQNLHLYLSTVYVD